jgi:hypothetical protein
VVVVVEDDVVVVEGDVAVVVGAVAEDVVVEFAPLRAATTSINPTPSADNRE